MYRTLGWDTDVNNNTVRSFWYSTTCTENQIVYSQLARRTKVFSTRGSAVQRLWSESFSRENVRFVRLIDSMILPAGTILVQVLHVRSIPTVHTVLTTPTSTVPVPTVTTKRRRKYYIIKK